ncbi:hypothetical protein D3C76_1449010 [compost metagenome]
MQAADPLRVHYPDAEPLKYRDTDRTARGSPAGYGSTAPAAASGGEQCGTRIYPEHPGSGDYREGGCRSGRPGY